MLRSYHWHSVVVYTPGRGLNVSSLVFKLALWICCKTNAFLYSLATRDVHRSAAIRSNASDVEHIRRSLGGLSVWYAVLVHPGVTRRMEQKLVFICWLYVLVSLFFPCYLLPGHPGNSGVLYVSFT